VKYRIVARYFKNKVVRIYRKHLIIVTSLSNKKSNEDQYYKFSTKIIKAIKDHSAIVATDALVKDRSMGATWVILDMSNNNELEMGR